MIELADKITSPSPIFYEKFSARNFNTSPLTISGLKGDSYDYTVYLWMKGNASSDNVFYFHPNSDTTSSNKRRYWMRGYSTTAQVSTTDSGDIEILSLKGTTICQCVCKITGDSSDERYFDIFQMGENGAAKEIRKTSGYWKNTVDELTSLQIKNNQSVTTDLIVAVFATPKDLSENWELVKTGSINQNVNSTPYDITGLDGDEDKVYKLVLEDQSMSGTPNMLMRFNGDTGATHQNQSIYNVNGTLYKQNLSYLETFNGESGVLAQHEYIIYAESGVKRIINFSISDKGGSFDQYEGTCWWNNTADNLTYIQISASASTTLTCNYKLYRIKNSNTVADRFNLPFKLLKTVDISGDFSGGHTFSGLEGDKALLYKISIIGTGGNNGDRYLRLRPNNDNGSNYSRQVLRTYGGNADANNTSDTYIELCDTFIGSLDEEFNIDVYIFPQSGENRPVLFVNNTIYSTSYLKIFGAAWWNNTADELTSLFAYMSNTNSTTAKMKLSYIPLPEAA